MYKLTAADFADTGQWRLLIELWETGLEAWLENTLHPEIPLQILCKVTWPLDKTQYKENLEKAVYENPRLLDDFATRITIHDSRTMFIPEDELEKPGAEGEIYGSIFDSKPEDVMYEQEDELTVAWNLGSGVRGFLLRTFPGARISNHLMALHKRVRDRNQGKCLYIRKNEITADFMLLAGEDLLCASTHYISGEEEIKKLTGEILEAYDCNPEEVAIDIEDNVR